MRLWLPSFPVRSIQDISTEDIIKLTENKVDEKEGSVVTTPTLPAPTSVQTTGFTRNYVPQMVYPTGVPGQPVFGSA